MTQLFHLFLTNYLFFSDNFLHFVDVIKDISGRYDMKTVLRNR